jgi:hypothetical protein
MLTGNLYPQKIVKITQVLYSELLAHRLEIRRSTAARRN